jgi:hypothetical protein
MMVDCQQTSRSESWAKAWIERRKSKKKPAKTLEEKRAAKKRKEGRPGLMP